MLNHWHFCLVLLSHLYNKPHSIRKIFRKIAATKIWLIFAILISFHGRSYTLKSLYRTDFLR